MFLSDHPLIRDSDSESCVPVFPIEQGSTEHAGLEDGRQGYDGDQCGVELHEGEEGEGSRKERLDGPPEALEGEHVDTNGEENPGNRVVNGC